jgi:phosphoribosylglycinamide formyltransferase-1
MRDAQSQNSSQKRVAVLISGRGSNLSALIDAHSAGSLGGSLCLVVSNRPNAGGLTLAANAGIETAVIDHRDYASREDFDTALVARLSEANLDLICLAGFMRILTPVFTDAFIGRVLNIHPSLLPDYPGLHTHQRAIDAGDTHGGASVHYVTGELDGGPVVLQARVPIRPEDSAEALAAKVLTVEHQIFPVAAQWHLSGKLALQHGQAVLDGEPLPARGVDWETVQ